MNTRLLAGLPLALVVSAALFWLMVLLVSWDPPTIVQPPPAVPLAMTRIVAEPPPPPPPVASRQAESRTRASLPEPSLPVIAPVELPSPSLQLPDFRPRVELSGQLQLAGTTAGVAGSDALAAFTKGERAFEGAELIPVSSARPKYPRSAANRGIEGWVELIFVVNGNGKVENVRVLDASPRGVFEDAAVNAISKWIYAPFILDGKPVAREGTQLFRFTREDIQEDYLWDD